MFFVALFRSWCHNAVSTFSLCLLAQAYEQAYNLLQILYGCQLKWYQIMKLLIDTQCRTRNDRQHVDPNRQIGTAP